MSIEEIDKRLAEVERLKEWLEEQRRELINRTDSNKGKA